MDEYRIPEPEPKPPEPEPEEPTPGEPSEGGEPDPYAPPIPPPNEE